MPNPPSDPVSSRLRGSRLVYGALALPLVVSPLAMAAPSGAVPTPEAPATAGWSTTVAPEEGKGTDVTLITGDTVRVTTTADGTQTVAVTPRSDSGRGFSTYQDGDDLYVVPNDVAGLIPDRLDPALFNVSALVEAGYTDDEMDTLPVILTYEEDRAVPSAARAVDNDPVELDSVNGLGVALDEEARAEVVATLDRLAQGQNARSARTDPLSGLDKIWLDAPVSAMLEHSVPQIGAPTAWDRGYDGTGVNVAVLDSGIDEEHPDLAGQVVARQNFSNSDTTDDRAGHGTHVASTIAGTGAASDGRFVGVAPGASLINVKVLDDFGNGSTSGVIQGMEWAAEQGADIINMSLGERGFYSDGTDPASVAVNTISDEFGVLFVIAAGNEGPRDGTVTSPAAADLALTVGAVDRQENIADFSSRGPRTGDHAVKPEITGPGVDIIAARAGGSNPMFPYDDNYAYMSGTSMATPHVVGAAALLAQARPDLDGQELKGLLVGSAVPNPELRVLDQGAGRVNVPTALDADLVADPVALSFGQYDYPHVVETVERTVTYRNLGDQPVTVDLTVAATNVDGEPAAEGTLTVDPMTVTVPAGGSSDVTVTFDSGVPGVGQFSGAVTATSAEGETHTTPLSYYKEPERYNVHIEGIARDGRPAQGSIRVLDVEDGSVSAIRGWGYGEDSCTTASWDASSCIRLEPGTYSFSGVVHTMPSDKSSTTQPGFTESYLNTSLLAQPEVTVDGPMTVTMDARDAVEVEVETPDHETRVAPGAASQLSYRRVAASGHEVTHAYMIGPRDQLDTELFIQPTEPVTQGQLTAYTQMTLEAPDVTLELDGADDVPLEPRYYDPYWFSDHSWQFPRLEGEHRLRVVDVGTATPEEVAGVDLDGALALVRRSDALSAGEQSNNAAQAGAAMVAVYHDTPGLAAFPGAIGVQLQVPTVRLTHEEGTALLDVLDDGPATVLATGQPASPYRYSLRLTEQGEISADQRHVLETEELAAVTNGFHSQLGGELTLTEAWYATQPWDAFAMAFPMPTLGGSRERVDYYIAAPDVRYQQAVDTPETRYNWLFPEDEVAQIFMMSRPRTFEEGERVDRPWFRGPLHPGLWYNRALVRSADRLDFRLAAFVDAAGNTAEAATSWFEGGFTTQMRLYADGELVRDTPYANGTIFDPPSAENYRLEYVVENAAPWAQLSTRASSVWTYRSAEPAAGEERFEPLLTVDYDLDVDLNNRLLAPSQRRGPLTVAFTVGHQNGAAQHPIRSGSLEVSYDGGQSWRSITNLRAVGDGRFVGNLPANLPKNNDGTLSLRMSAQDSAGNTVEQEVLRAVGLWE